MPKAVPASRITYWKEREARWQAFVQQHGPDFAAFAKVEKPFAAQQKAAEKKKSPRARARVATSCAGNETPKMVFGTPRCVPEESPMSDIVDRMRILAGITSAFPEVEPALSESDEKAWNELSAKLDSVVELTKNLLRSRGLDADGKRMLTDLLHAAVTVRKSVDGD